MKFAILAILSSLTLTSSAHADVSSETVEAKALFETLLSMKTERTARVAQTETNDAIGGISTTTLSVGAGPAKISCARMQTDTGDTVDFTCTLQKTITLPNTIE